MRVQPVFSSSMLSSGNKQNRYMAPIKANKPSFMGENDIKEEPKLSVKQQNDKMIKDYYVGFLYDLGYQPIELQDGTYMLKTYRSADIKDFSSYGVKEEEIFKYVSYVRDLADLRGSQMTSTMNLKGAGKLNMQGSMISDMSGVKEVLGDIHLSKRIKTLGDTEIGGRVHFDEGSKINPDTINARGLRYIKHYKPSRH